MIYFCKNELINLDMIKYLPEKRREKVDRLKQEIDKKNAIAAWLLLLYALKKTDLPDFSYDKNKKPYFKELPDFYFNISHCKIGAVCAVSESPVGVDIQDIRPFNLSAAKRVCNDSELKLLGNSQNIDYEFIKLWTKKESILKQSGKGIGGGIKSAIPDCKFSVKTYCYENYIISICE